MSPIDMPAAEKAVRELLAALGERPDRPGLADTPRRVARMYGELLAGAGREGLDDIKLFDEPAVDGMVAVRGIAFQSVCEHHLLPFFGSADICYIPAPGKLLGLSKLARVVETYARRLSLQERLCGQIADCVMEDAGALGVAVRVAAEHMCMAMRGVKKPGAVTVTTALRGLAKTEPGLRREALAMLGAGG